MYNSGTWAELEVGRAALSITENFHKLHTLRMALHVYISRVVSIENKIRVGVRGVSERSGQSLDEHEITSADLLIASAQL